MTTTSSFRIFRIRAVLRQNGSMDGVEAMFCKCEACGDQSRLSKGHGLQDVEEGVQLTCPACNATGVVPTAKIWAQWAEQLRRDRVLALAGIGSADLDSP